MAFVDQVSGDPFDSALHRKMKATTIEGWQINDQVALLIVSTFPYVLDYNTCVVIDGATLCGGLEPPLANLILSALGMFLLVRHLTGSAGGAFIAGIAYGFCTTWASGI